MIRSLRRLGALVVVALLALPAAAQAAQINGNPLVVSSDDSGRLGAAFAGSTSGEFYGSGVDPESGVLRPGSNAGFRVTVLPPDGSARVFGYSSGQAPTSPSTATGSGTAADPFVLRTTWAFTSPVDELSFEVRQELTYVNGERHFRARYDVVNTGPTGIPLRASMGADLAGGGSDSGVGLFEPGPPRFVAGVNPDVGSVTGLAEVTPWSHFEEGHYADVLRRAAGDPRAGENLADTIDPNRVDNGAAVQWDQHVGAPLMPGQTATFEVLWRFAPTFSLVAPGGDLTTGDTTAIEAAVFDSSGNPRGDALIRWSSSGVNTLSGSVRTGSDGKALIEYVGANPGVDVLTAYVDANSNDTRDTGEPFREVRVTWVGLEAPAFAEEVNVKPVSGRVLVRLPRNAKVKGKWAQAAQLRFVPLEDIRQIPVGAEMDTSRGRVQITSAKGLGSTEVQSSQFYSGRFQVLQPRNARGVTEMKMTGPLSCRQGRSKVTSAQSRSRRLWGRGRGRFRTRGRNSSATVRGTIWLVKDTCTTTTTTVREGTVIVRDFAKRKNVRVKAGRRYVARARRR